MTVVENGWLHEYAPDERSHHEAHRLNRDNVFDNHESSKKSDASSTTGEPVTRVFSTRQSQYKEKISQHTHTPTKDTVPAGDFLFFFIPLFSDDNDNELPNDHHLCES